MNYLKENWEKYLEDIKGLIKIQSWLKDAKDYPTPQMKEALEYMISLAKRDGMTNYFIEENGHYGYIEIGSGEELIGIIGHLDVVPPGDANSWDSEPFELTEKEGKLYARGIQDDKGPVMIGYYLMKELFEEGNLNKRIRLIMGTDEETLWRGIDKYIADGQEHVTYGIAPDSAFPVTYSERALLQYLIKSDKPVEGFELTGGVAFNAVADSATLTVNGSSKEFKGKTAHAMEPWEGHNAIYDAVGELESDHNLIKFIKEGLNNEVNGKTLFGEIIKDDDAELTFNIGKINMKGNEAILSMDSRLPNTISLEDFEAKLKVELDKYGLTYERYDYLQGVYIPKDSQIVKDLMSTYQEITGDMTEPQASGGATYARGMENVVAFGPLFNYTEITEHQPNEHISIEEFQKVYEIYYKSFKKWLNH